MANNPYVNKVQLANGQTLIDISSDTVTPNSLMRGYTAHDASGASITGTAEGGGSGDGYVWQDGEGYVHLSDEGGTQYVVSQLIAEEYDSTATYDIGDYCSYNGGFYVCSTAISTAEAWNSNHWVQVTVADELTDLKEDIDSLNTQKVSIPITIQATLSPTIYSQTVTDSRIKSNHIVLSTKASAGNMAYLAVDVTVTTSNGQAVVSTPSAPSAELTMDITLIEQAT